MLLISSRRMKKLWVITILVSFLGITTAAYGQGETPSLEILKTENTPVFDGILNEPEWEMAPRISSFTQRELNLGEPVTERTEVAILTDAEYMYIGVWLLQSAQ